MRGRQPKPTKQKEFEGNPGKRALRNVPEPAKPATCPAPAAGIGKYARKFWKDYAFGIWSLGLLTQVDLPAWTFLCRAIQRWHEANDSWNGEYIEVTPSGTKKPVPLVVMHKEEENIAKYMAKFGMTPVDRERINSEGGLKDNPFEKFIGGGN